MRTAGNRAFTIVELLIVIAIVAILATMITPTVLRVRELAQQAACNTNTKALITGLTQYASDSGAMPKVPVSTWDTAVGSNWKSDPFMLAADGSPPPPKARNHSSNLWLLIRGEHLAPEALICPATTDVTSDFQKAENFWDFGSTRFLSYGLQSPYGYGGSLSVLTPSGVILVADGSPYVQTETGFDPGKIKPPAQLKIVDWGSGMDGDQKMFWGNSPNHDGKGQNVGYFGGQAEWRTGANCGKNGDNIYTATNKDGSNEDTATSSAGVLSSGVRNNEFDTLILP